MVEEERLRENVIELLLLIMHEDCAYVVGGPKRLDEAAWRIARQLPDPPADIAIYLLPGDKP